MKVFSFLHHTFLHIPIVASPILAIISTYWLVTGSKQLENLMRFLGEATALAFLVVVLSGFLADSHELDPYLYTHHRNLGFTTAITATIAAIGVEWGIRSHEHKMTQFGALMWWVVTFGAFGAGHWGATLTHENLF